MMPLRQCHPPSTRPHSPACPVCLVCASCRKPVKTLTTKERKKSRFGNAFHLTR